MSEEAGQGQQAQPTSQPNAIQGSWRESLPQDLQTHPTIGKFQDVGSLAKSYIELQKQGGNIPENYVPVPEEGWTENDWTNFYNKVGRPEKPDGYEFQKPELPQGLDYDPNMDNWFKDTAHKLGLTKAQAAKLRAEFVGVQTKGFEGQAQQQAQTEAQQQQAFSQFLAGLGDQQKQALDGARRVIQDFGGDEFRNLIKERGLDDHPVMAKFLVQMGKAFSDDRVILNGMSAGGGAFSGTPAGAAAEIRRLMGDKEFGAKLGDASKPGHADAKARWNKLHEIAYS
jgi:hypothetical protein